MTLLTFPLVLLVLSLSFATNQSSILDRVSSYRRLVTSESDKENDDILNTIDSSILRGMDMLSFFNKTLNRESKTVFNDFITKRMLSKETSFQSKDVFSKLDDGVIIIIGAEKDYIYKVVKTYPQFTFINIVSSTIVFDYYSMLDFLYPEEVGRFFTISMDITVATYNSVVKALKDVSIGAIIIRDFDTIAFGNHYDIDSILPIEEFKQVLVSMAQSAQYLSFPKTIPYNDYFNEWVSGSNLAEYIKSFDEDVKTVTSSDEIILLKNTGYSKNKKKCLPLLQLASFLVRGEDIWGVIRRMSVKNVNYESINHILLCGDRIITTESKQRGSTKLRRLSSSIYYQSFGGTSSSGTSSSGTSSSGTSSSGTSSSGISSPSISTFPYTSFFNLQTQKKPDEEEETFDELYLINQINEQRKKEEKAEMSKYQDITGNINNGYYNTIKKFNTANIRDLAMTSLSKKWLSLLKSTNSRLFTEKHSYGIIHGRVLSKLAMRLGRDNVDSIILHLSEPFNNTRITNFTWSLQTINSIKTTNSFATYQVIPLEITLLLVSHLKEAIDCESIFASILQLAKTTFIEIPNLSLLNVASSFFDSVEGDTPYDSFLSFMNSIQESDNPFKTMIEMINDDLSTSNFGEFSFSELEGQIHSNTRVFKVEFVPREAVEDREGFTVYSLLKFGVGDDIKRSITEAFLKLPIERIIQDKVITSIPPWNLFLMLDKHNEYNILYRSKEIDYTTQEYEETIYSYVAPQIQIDQQTDSHFSLIRWNSEYGESELRIAKEHPEASIYSVGPSNTAADDFIESVSEEGVTNAWRFISSYSKQIADHVHKSPELFRYQIITPHTVFKPTAVQSPVHINTTRASLGNSLTTFIYLPSPILLSIAFEFLFIDPACSSPLPFSHSPESYAKRNINRYSLSNYPSVLFKDYKTEWIKLLLRKKNGYSIETSKAGDDGWIRIDMRNSTRLVNHHYLSEIDGHQRKYFMHIESPPYLDKIYSLPGRSTSSLPSLPSFYHINKNQYSAVYLIREEDGSRIPYEHIYGVTLIFGLRLHLHISQRQLLYSQFLQLPLYEDMTSWNILITGSTLSYIDFDTQKETYDSDIVKVYRILEVLTNYQRTIMDFNKCRERADNPVYNFDLISECVGSLFNGPCKDTEYPIPCGDGTCQSDYISCLRSEDGKGNTSLKKKYLRDY